MRRRWYVLIFVLLVVFSGIFFAATTLSTLKETDTAKFIAIGAVPTANQISYFNGGAATVFDTIGVQSETWEESVSGTAPATVSIAISGCMRSGTCLALTTGTSTTSAIFTSSGLYDNFKVAVSWTGGDSTTAITMNMSASVTRFTTGAVIQNVATIVNAWYGTNWVEATGMAGGDIETQLSNACSALAAKGAGGGFITISFAGTQAGALGSNPFTNCPDNSAPGNGTIIFIISPPNGVITTSAPWLTPNKSRIYFAFGHLARSWTTIRAGNGFKTMANLRRATLAQTTGLSRVTGTVTATFTNTDAVLGLAMTQFEPVQLMCGTHGDQTFVGIFALATASATNVTWVQKNNYLTGVANADATNTNGTCTIMAGTPIIGLAENKKVYNNTGAGVITYGNPNPGNAPCTTDCYGNATAAFGAGFDGGTVDCDMTSGATGCIGIRNIYSQEKTYVNDISITNFNFIGMVLDNMSSSGLQNSGPYTNMELYAAPLADSHADFCGPFNFNDGASNLDPYPLEAIFTFGLSIRNISGYTATTGNCGTRGGGVVNNNPTMISVETSNTGNMEMGTSGTVHCEHSLICNAAGYQQAQSGGLTIIGLGGSPTNFKYTCGAPCAGGTTYNPVALMISNNFAATTDISALNIRRNFGMTSSIFNQASGDNLNGTGDAVTAAYYWDTSSTLGSTTLTTSQSAMNRVNGLAANRLISSGGVAAQMPTVACTNVTSCALVSGSSDSFGTVQLTGNGAGTTGVITLTFSTALGAFGGHIPGCVGMISNQAAGTWNASATLFDNGGDSTLVTKLLFSNNAVALTAATVFNVNYICAGHN